MCSLEEAFMDFTEPRPVESEKKRHKKRRTALPPPEPEVIEPDRPAHRPLPPAELLGGAVTSNTYSTSGSEMLNALDTSSYAPHPAKDSNDANVYKLEPDWTKVFNNDSVPDWIKTRMPSRAAEAPLTPSPWVDGYSTLWSRIPDSLGADPSLRVAETKASSRIDELQSRLDSMFTKLDEMEVTRSESNHLEIILFVLGGIFLLLLLDIIVKQGTQATMLIARAGGGLPAALKGFRITP